jgi:hypothetical protein
MNSAHMQTRCVASIHIQYHANENIELDYIGQGLTYVVFVFDFSGDVHIPTVTPAGSDPQSVTSWQNATSTRASIISKHPV